MSHGPFGKRPERLPIQEGGTAASTEAEAREILDVPGLEGPNVLNGDLTVNGTTTLNNGLEANYGSVSLRPEDGIITLANIGAPTHAVDITISGLSAGRAVTWPDADGTLLLDAPSDGKYYVRKDGAWVEIIP